jgi:hypothetical protein
MNLYTQKRGFNVVGDLIVKEDRNGKLMYSTSCSTDLFKDEAEYLRRYESQGGKVAVIGQINSHLPYLFGDSELEPDFYDFVLDDPKFDFTLFSAPRGAISTADYLTGLYTSLLFKDGGTIQIGIGSVGDAIVSGLLMRHNENDIYQQVLNQLRIPERYSKLIEELGGKEPFEEGLFGGSEMMVEGFLELLNGGVIKRKVYDNVTIQKMLNNNTISENNIPPNILELMLEDEAFQRVLTKKDFEMLTYFGILKNNLTYENDVIYDGNIEYSADFRDPNNIKALEENCLGSELLHGFHVQTSFYLGSQNFYRRLKEMPEEERLKINMREVKVVNQLYGDEKLRTIQRKKARFVNVTMMVSLLGDVNSDQLENGLVVSGVGGQFNFVMQANTLDDAHAIMLFKSIKKSGKILKSNVKYSYGHTTIPRFLKDIVVNEYGIAYLQGKSDAETIMEMLNITDSRFQQALLEEAKLNKKIPQDYEIPPEYRNNFPEKLEELVSPLKKQGLFQPFPFGSDYTEEEKVLGGALRTLKAASIEKPLNTILNVLKMPKIPPEKAMPYLIRMDLAEPKTSHERILQKEVMYALKLVKKI